MLDLFCRTFSVKDASIREPVTDFLDWRAKAMMSETELRMSESRNANC